MTKTIDLKKLADLMRDKNRSASANSDRGVLLAWIEPEKEPSKHFINDMSKMQAEFNSWGGHFIFLTTDPVRSNHDFNLNDYKGLPANSTSAYDKNADLLNKIWISGSRPDLSFPLIILADAKRNILYRSSRYHIGTSEQILKSIKRGR